MKFQNGIPELQQTFRTGFHQQLNLFRDLQLVIPAEERADWQKADAGQQPTLQQR